MITNRNLKFFQKAKSLTEYSDFKGVHIGCAIVNKNRVIGEGFNTYKTHPMQKRFNAFRKFNEMNNMSHVHALHAEIMALVSVKDEKIDWGKVEVYIYRKMRKRAFGMARPCPACMMALKLRGVKHIYYTSDDGLVYENIDQECINKLRKEVV